MKNHTNLFEALLRHDTLVNELGDELALNARGMAEATDSEGVVYPVETFVVTEWRHK